MKKLHAKIFNIISISFLIALSTIGCTQKEEIIILSCSGDQSDINPFNFQLKTGQFNDVSLKIRKIGDKIISITINNEELTNERRATNPQSPNFLRWFEQNSDGFITYGKNSTDNKPPSSNIKLTSSGIFERQGIGITQKGTCVPLKKAF
jgi:hypothetical protein